VTVAERLKTFRAYMGLQQSDLADCAGIHLQTVSRYERGIQVPKMVTVDAWHAAYALRPAWLLSSDGPMLDGALSLAGQIRLLLETTERDERIRILETLLKEEQG
jgi:transcriptional regulator with XRE-family HTH domain